MVAQAQVVSLERVAALDQQQHGVTLKLTFPGRRYHATPWHHHVNEGLVEWPPSPWRLLRAFLATGYSKLRWPADNPSELARSLIEKLSSVLPRYRLPIAVGTHSRHYMPMARFDKGREQTTLVLDTWAQIEDDWLGIHWDVILDEGEVSILSEIVRELGYLGRSESWVEGELIYGQDLNDFLVAAEEERPGTDWEQVPLLAPELPERYARWRKDSIESEQAKLPAQNSKGKAFTKPQLTKRLADIENAYPKDLIASLQVDTRFLHELGWSQPPGTRKVFYWRPTAALNPSPAHISKLPEAVPNSEFALLAIAAENNNNGNLPSSIRTLPQGELLHRALLSKFPDRDVPQVLSGRDTNGEPLRTSQSHRHLHILHLDLDGDEHLDHVLLWAPMGIDDRAQRAIRAARHEFAKDAKAAHRLALAAMGDRGDMLRIQSELRPQIAERLHRFLGGVAGAKEWVSATPFIPPRYLKPSGKNSLEGQLRSELLTRGLPEPVHIDVLQPSKGPTNDQERARKARHFIRRRAEKRQPPPVDCGFTVRLKFANEVRGPLMLGYGCHFGLGAFEAC